MIGRLLEAIAVGIIFPSFQTVLLTITPHSERGRVMGTAGLVMGSALAVGPIISGVLLTWFPWRLYSCSSWSFRLCWPFQR